MALAASKLCPVTQPEVESVAQNGENRLLADTEGSFFVERARAMAEAFVRHMRKLAAASPEPEQQVGQ